MTEKVLLQEWDPEKYARNASFVPEYGLGVLEWLGDFSGKDVLDLGCGDGSLSQQIVKTGGKVIGIDASSTMVAKAVASGIDARVMDARELVFDRSFDAVFTNATLHWVQPASAVARGVFGALRLEGKYVGEFGGHGNMAAVVTAVKASLLLNGHPDNASNPWYFPTVLEFKSVLEEAGFEVERIETFCRPTKLPGEMLEWLHTFGGAFVLGLSGEVRTQVFSDAQDLLRDSLCNSLNEWTADYVRLRFCARKPAS